MCKCYDARFWTGDETCTSSQDMDGCLHVSPSTLQARMWLAQSLHSATTQKALWACAGGPSSFLLSSLPREIALPGLLGIHMYLLCLLICNERPSSWTCGLFLQRRVCSEAALPFCLAGWVPHGTGEKYALLPQPLPCHTCAGAKGTLQLPFVLLTTSLISRRRRGSTLWLRQTPGAAHLVNATLNFCWRPSIGVTVQESW